jgi:protein-tyrosine phosphatase
MFKIRDWLLISGFPSASSPNLVKSQGVQASLQLFEAIQMDGVDSLFIEVQDGHEITPAQIRKGVDFVREHQQKGKRVLITCGAGISRSVTFSIASLKEIEGLSLPDAYRAIRQHHPEAMPDHIHWKSIADFYGENGDFWEIWGDIMLGEDE